VDDHGALAGGEGEVGEGEIDAAADAITLHVEGRGADIADFNVFELFIDVRPAGGALGMIHDLGDTQGRKARIVGACGRAGPAAGDGRVVRSGHIGVGWIPGPGKDPDVVGNGNGDGSIIGEGAGGETAAGSAGIGAVEGIDDPTARF
jgi:hypothetical protein